MKYIKTFENIESDYMELKLELWRNNKWKEIENPSSIYPDAILCYEYELRTGYNLQILDRQTSSDRSYSIYLKSEKYDTLNYLDNVFNPYHNKFYRQSEYNRYLEFTIRLGKNAMQYYDKLEKLLPKEDLKVGLLTELTDEGYYFDDDSDIDFGFFQNISKMNLSKFNIYDIKDKIEVEFYKDYNDIFGYLMFIHSNKNINKNEVEGIMYQIEGKLEYYSKSYNEEYNLYYIIVDNIIVMTITLK